MIERRTPQVSYPGSRCAGLPLAPQQAAHRHVDFGARRNAGHPQARQVDGTP